MNKEIKLFNHIFKNPIMPASGTFGFGYEFSSYYDLNILGSIVLKGTTLEERFGNPLPRIADCPNGLLNSIGLQNPGIDKVINEELVKLKQVYNDKVIINVGGHSFEDYLKTCEKCNNVESILAVELNISCPNVKEGGMQFGVDEEVAYKLVKEVKKVLTKPLIVKLSPNVTDIVKMAKSVEKAGADAISLINTLVGMRIDLNTKKPILAVKKGGYSGPGVYPVALRMVYDVYENVNIPIIGMGGISSANDVIEMMLAGASLVEIGSLNLVDPLGLPKIINDLDKIMVKYNISDLNSIIGLAHK